MSLLKQTRKLILGQKNKTSYVPDEKSHGLEVYNENDVSHNIRSRSPVSQKKFQAKSATSIVARVKAKTGKILEAGEICRRTK